MNLREILFFSWVAVVVGSHAWYAVKTDEIASRALRHQKIYEVHCLKRPQFHIKFLDDRLRRDNRQALLGEPDQEYCRSQEPIYRQRLENAEFQRRIEEARSNGRIADATWLGFPALLAGGVMYGRFRGRKKD